jgi:hypothetical protein
VAQDWLFLALAHHRLGHAAEAAQALQTARTRPAAAVAPDSWDNLEVELLRREAEAVITGKAAEPSEREQKRKTILEELPIPDYSSSPFPLDLARARGGSTQDLARIRPDE